MALLKGLQDRLGVVFVLEPCVQRIVGRYHEGQRAEDAVDVEGRAHLKNIHSNQVGVHVQQLQAVLD